METGTFAIWMRPKVPVPFDDKSPCFSSTGDDNPDDRRNDRGMRKSNTHMNNCNGYVPSVTMS
jgi:hypothetical protein